MVENHFLGPKMGVYPKRYLYANSLRGIRCFMDFLNFFLGNRAEKRYSPSLESEAAPLRGLAELHVPAKEKDA